MQDLIVTRTAKFEGAVVTGLNVGGLMGKGRVFYVDASSGADGYGVQSQNPNYPMETITGAMDICTSAVGDVIVVMANSPSSPAANETFPVAMDVQGVLLTGLYSRGLLSDSGFGSDEQNVATIEIGANYTAVENIYLGVDNLGSTGGIVQFNGTNSYYATVFRNVLFDTQYIPAYGVYAVYDQPYLLVEDCFFGRSDIAGYSTAGISLGNGTGNVIRRNVFKGNAGIGINLGTNCGQVTVYNNLLECNNGANGEGITAGTSSSNNLIVDNVASYGMLSTGYTYNPYKDLASNTANHWARNYRQNAIVEPVGA